jgi:hypothetical protein
MDVVALVAWIVTALGGATMAGIWLAHRGPAQYRAGVSRIPPTRLAAHVALAATGLAFWIAYVATDTEGFGWAAFALLPVAAGIGLLMFMTWLAERGVAAADVSPAENRFPFALVAAHGIFAVATLVLVLVAVIG